jgi:drug/metabolite transporter (DMT)-like permease
LKEKVSTKIIFYAVFALLGVYLLSFPTLLPAWGTVDERARLMAIAFAFLAALAWGGGTVLSKLSLNEINYKAATAGRFAITIVASLIIAVVLGQTYPISQITLSQVGAFVLIALFVGAVPMLIYYKGLNQTQAKVSTFMELTLPITAFLLDVFVFGSHFTETQLIGMILLLWMITNISRLNKAELNTARLDKSGSNKVGSTKAVKAKAKGKK